MYEFRPDWKIIEMTVRRASADMPASALITFCNGEQRIKWQLLNPRPIETLTLLWNDSPISIRDQNQHGKNSLDFGRYLLQSWDAGYQKERVEVDDVQELEIGTM